MRIEVELGIDFLKLSDADKLRVIDNVLDSDECKGVDCTRCPLYCYYGSSTPSEFNCRGTFLWREFIEGKSYAVRVLEHMKKERDFNFSKNLMIIHHYLEITKEQFYNLEYTVLDEYHWNTEVLDTLNHITNYVFNNENYLEEIVSTSDEVEVRSYYSTKLISICFNGKVVAIHNTDHTYIIDKDLEKEFKNFIFLKMVDKSSCGDKYLKTDFKTIQVIDSLHGDKGVAVINNKIMEVSRNDLD